MELIRNKSKRRGPIVLNNVENNSDSSFFSNMKSEETDSEMSQS